MRGSIKLFDVLGISINIHITFFLLLLLVLPGGVKWVFVVIAVFFFVTMHELCHSLVARRFGIKVREITLLPIGGVASMAKMPEKPIQEFLISVAGPLSNIAVILVLFIPLKSILGEDVLLDFLRTGRLSTATWPLTFAYIYWINLFLAGFNMLPAFPMDGGRILRSLLAARLGYRKATRIAVNFGHVFALIFAYFGIAKFNIMLLIIAFFIYSAASSEELQADVKETLKKFRVRDILPPNCLTLSGSTTLAKVLELVFHSHQEDFPVVDAGELAGFITRQDIMANVHQHGTDKLVKDIMRRNFPKAREADSLIKVQAMMEEHGLRALPVVKDGVVAGVVTLEDIGRVYSIASQRT
jgi:Zn-dependent protease/CBS domain-containing protein